MKKITIGEIAKATGAKIYAGEEENAAERVITHVTTDSRQIQEGSLFVPLKGEKTDGHNFIDQSFEKGAAACFSEEEREVPKNGVLLLVKDCKAALLEAARYYRRLFDIPIIGITGSVGKTTTKDMVASVLSQKYCTLWTQGNYNNDIGVPLTLFRLEEKHEAAVIEMGMNHFDEIHRLADVVRPQVGLISNVGVAHIEFLGSREGILKAKCELFDFMTEKDTAILNADNDMLQTMEGKLSQKIRWFGVENQKDIYADHLEAMGMDGTKCTLHTEQGSMEIAVPIPGRHMVLNAVSAAAVGIVCGLDLDEIRKGIEGFVPTKNRMTISHTESGMTLLNDVYNSNPVSAKASLDILENAEGRKIAFLGFMGELGAYAPQMHNEVGAYAAGKTDVLICVGTYNEEMAKGAKEAGMKNVYCFDTQEQFWQEGLDLLEKGDTILLKASRSMGFEKTVEKLQGVK